MRSSGLPVTVVFVVMVEKLLIVMIRSYQIFISPLLGPTCRFVPSCSAYAVEALRKFGVARGVWLTMKRLLKCHPFHPGGYDPV